jgi:hypothetical protein
VGSNCVAYSEKKRIYANRDYAHVGVATLMYQRSGGKKIPVTENATARMGETHDKVMVRLLKLAGAKPIIQCSVSK